MARRRLTLPGAMSDVPRAEHSDFPHLPRLTTQLSPAAAPIARVAADAASTAAAEELARTLATARETGHLVLDLPLDAIAPDHLLRDRLPAEDAEMAALRDSLRAHGQRMPIEVTEVAGALPYGLLSGWRRLAALKALHAETGEARFATVQALVRRPDTVQDAYVGMVEENEIRVGLSHYERARVAALATRRGVFPSEKAALLALFATASRPKRSRIRAFLEIYHALDGTLRFPAHLPERLGLALVGKVRTGGRDAIADAIAREDPATPEAELALLAHLVRPQPVEAARRSAPEMPAEASAEIRPGVRLEARLSGRTPMLRLTGQGVTPALAAEIRTLLVRAPG